MVLCPECGTEVEGTEDFCRDCGTDITNVESTEEARIHLREKEDPVICDSVSYPSMGGNWIRAKMDDGSKRIYPIDRIEYIETGAEYGSGSISALPGNAQVKEVDSFDTLGKLISSFTN
jgi:NMD protein affecting ribosome stability and mRNA decay